MSNPYYQNDNSYEMGNYNAPSTAYGNSYQNQPYDQAYGQAPQSQPQYSQPSGGDDVAFFNEIKQTRALIDNYNVLIGHIRSTQRKLLNEVDEQQEYRLSQEVDNVTAQASSQQSEIKAKLQFVTNKAGSDVSKKAQVDQVKSLFMDSIRNYQGVESDFKNRAKEQAITQYQVVDPNISRQDAEAVISDAGQQQIFSQALLNSSMRGQAQSALNEVKARHKEILKVEQSMRELQMLFQDVENLVAEQDVKVEEIGDNISDAHKNIGGANDEVERARKSGEKARRKKCWIMWICIVIAIIIIAAIVGGIAGKFANKS